MYLLGVMITMSIIAFIAMGMDKWKAKKGQWRIPEHALFAFAILLGAPGAYMGMLVFRHKTRHKRFSIGFPVLFIIEILFVTWAVLADLGVMA